MKEQSKTRQHPPTVVCPCCGGTGQLGSFKGESRFMITWEECTECLGTGRIPEENPSVEKKDIP